jgi:IS30 family transposase
MSVRKAYKKCAKRQRFKGRINELWRKINELKYEDCSGGEIAKRLGLSRMQLWYVRREMKRQTDARILAVLAEQESAAKAEAMAGKEGGAK